MSEEEVKQYVITCDGCGCCQVVGVDKDSAYASLENCGWITREREGKTQHLCPTCRPDSPFDQMRRVADFAEYITKHHGSDLVRIKPRDINRIMGMDE